ncbi:MAG: DUF4012 domain-containing protein [Patescibacteria group bacterium]
MKQPAPSSVNVESLDLPIARIDAQDLAQSLPLREYLEANGCAVVLNRKSSILETYHIICGDKDFVKECLEHVDVHDVYPFVVLFVPTKNSSPDVLSTIHAKIAVTSSLSLSTREVTQIFAFFFTGQGNIFEHDHEHVSHSDSLMGEMNNNILVEESPRGDSARVSHTTPDLYSENMPQKHEHPKNKHHELLPHHRKLRQKRPFLYFMKFALLFLSIIFIPVLWYMVSLFMVAGVQWIGYREIGMGKTTHIATVTNITSYWLAQARGALGFLSLPLGVARLGSVVRSQERVLSIVADIVASELAGTTLLRESGHLAPLIMTGKEPATNAVSLLVVVDRTRLALEQLTNRLGLAEAELRILTGENGFPLALPISQRLIGRLQKELGRSLAATRVMQQLVALYRATAGFDRKKTYLLTLQNSMELRPTGGFIGSIALVTVSDGLLNDFAVQDVYALDGQLKGHVDPPVPIKDLLNQEHWYLRDSNWDPDFRISGERAAWFYEKETGDNVDGVIAVSVPFLTELLDVTGPLDLPDYNDRITKDNFFGKSLYYTKADFFPGSTQKKDFLSSLTVAIIAKLSSGVATDILGLSRAMGNALESGDIQFWFPDSQSQALAENAGWTGRIDGRLACEPSCTVERVRLVEANMSVNKVNAYIARSIKVRTDVSEEGVIDSTVEVLFKNASVDDAVLMGGGVYRTYLRAYLPEDALVLSITIDGNEIPKRPTKHLDPLVLPYRDTEMSEGNLMSVGVAFDVPPANVPRKITIIYRRGKLFVFDDNKGEFILQIRKQPGTTQTTLDATIGYPAKWQAIGNNEHETENARVAGFLANARELRYNKDLNHTETFSVQFIASQ